MQKLKEVCLSLSAYALNGGVEKLKKEIETAVFVIEALAIKGEFTVFAAPPNGGKTLLIIAGLIKAVKGGIIDGEKVFYINCDDNQRGAIAKTEIVEPLGIKMVVPVLADRDLTRGARFDIVAILTDKVENKNVDGEILILDTYKKFMSVMKKDQQSDFNSLLRDFVSMGGTIIVLAHTNKNKDADGWNIGGTSDLKDDCDCCWIIDPVDTGNGRVYNFKFAKGRGVDGESKAFFVPTVINDDYTERYREMLAGVKPHAVSDKREIKKNELSKSCHVAITLIKEELASGQKTWGELVDAYNDSDVKYEVSRRKFLGVLGLFAGELWSVQKSGRKKVFTGLDLTHRKSGSSGSNQADKQ